MVGGKGKERPAHKQKRSLPNKLMKTFIFSIVSQQITKCKGGRIWLKRLSRLKKLLS